MKKVLSCIFIAAAGILCSFCASSEPGARSQTSYKEIAALKLGNKIEYLFNESGTYVIALKREEETAQNPFPFTRFIIFKTGESKIIFEERLMISGIRWISETEAEAITHSGIVSSDAPDRKSGYIFDAAAVRKREL